MASGPAEGAPILTVRRTFAAARERVFHAWTTASAVARWFRPMGQPVVVRALDARVGGVYCFELVDGGGTIEGVYLEVVPPERLAFTWVSAGTQHQETLVTVEFIARDGATEVVLTHARLSGDALRALHRAGWESVLDKLASVLASDQLGA